MYRYHDLVLLTARANDPHAPPQSTCFQPGEIPRISTGKVLAQRKPHARSTGRTLKSAVYERVLRVWFKCPYIDALGGRRWIENPTYEYEFVYQTLRVQHRPEWKCISKTDLQKRPRNRRLSVSPFRPSHWPPGTSRRAPRFVPTKGARLEIQPVPPRSSWRSPPHPLYLPLRCFFSAVRLRIQGCTGTDRGSWATAEN